MDRGRFGRGNGGSPLAAPRRPRTSGFRELSGPVPKDGSKLDTDSEMQESPGSDVPPIHTLAQALARQKRKRPGSANDLGDDSLDESGSGEQEETEDKHSEPAKGRETLGVQADAPNKIPRRARSVLAKRLDPMLPARGNDLGAAPYASSPSAASVPSGRGPRRGRMPQKMRNSNKMKRQEMAAAAATVSEQEREVAEALFGLANMAALMPSSPPASPVRSASPAAQVEEAIADSPNTAVNDAAAALVQACSPALSVEGDDDSQPIISLKGSAPVSFSTPVEDKKQTGQKSAKREGHQEDGGPPASTNLPALEATAVVPLKRKRPRARAKAEPVSASKDGGALAVLGAAAANLVEESRLDAKMETDNLLAPGLDVLAASVEVAKDLGKAEKPVGPPIAAFKAEKKRAAAEKKAKAEAAEKLAQRKVEATDGDDGKGGLDVSEGNVPIIAPKTKEPRKRKEKENKGQAGEKKEKKRSKVDADGTKKSGHGNKTAKPEAEQEFVREGSYSDKSDREPIKPASQKSAKAAKREALAASLKAEKAAAEKEPVSAPPVARPSPVMQPAAPTASPAPTSGPSTSTPAPASATAPQGPVPAVPAWAQPNMSPMFYNQAMAAMAANWPNQLPMDGRDGGGQPPSAPSQAHLPPGPSYTMLPPLPRPWKRCAFHVYIAHYIEYQQTLLQLSNAGVFLRLPPPPPTPIPITFGHTNTGPPPPPGMNGAPSSGGAETGPVPAPSATGKNEKGPVTDAGEGTAQQGPKEFRMSAFQDMQPRKASQQPAGPVIQPASNAQYTAPPPQNTSPSRSQQAPAPSSEPPQAPPVDPSTRPNQGVGQPNSTNSQGAAQANAQAAYAAQQLALLQQNGYPFPFNPASLNLPPFPVPGANAHFAGLSPAALAQYMAYMQHIGGVPPGLPPQLMHGHQAPSEHLPQPAAAPSSGPLDIKPTPLARPNLNQQPMQVPRAPQQNEPPRDEREQKVRPNLNNRPLRPPQQGDNLVREINDRKHFGERGGQTRPQPTEGSGAMMNFLEQQSREQQARQQQQQQQQKMGAPYQRPPFDLPPNFLQNPELLYQNKLPQEMMSGWKDGPYKQNRLEGPPNQQPQTQQRHPSIGGNERNGPPQPSIGPGPLGLNPAAAGMVPRGHTTMMGSPGMLPPGPNMPQNIQEILAEAQRRGVEQEAQRPRPPLRTEEIAELQRRGLEEEARRPRVPTLTEELAEIQRRGMEQERQKRERQERDRQRPASDGNHQGGPPDGGLQQYRDMYLQQMSDGRMQPQPQPQVQRGGPPANENPGQRGRDGGKSGSKQGGKASPSLDLEGPTALMGGPQSRGGLGPQGAHGFAQPQRSGGGQTAAAQNPSQKTVLPRGKHQQLGPPGQQFSAGPERMGSSGQQMGMQKGYAFAATSGPGPNFGTGGLGSSSGRPIVSQSFGAMSQQPQQPQKQMSQGGGMSMGSGQPGVSGPNQMSRLVDLSAPNQQRPVGPGVGNYLQRTGSLGPMPQGQGNPPKGAETFPRQQGKNGKGSVSANFAKPAPNSGVLFNQQRLPAPTHNMPPGMVAQQHMVGMPMPGGDDKSWQYRNHGSSGGDAKPAGKKAEDETKKKAERERRQAQKRQKEHTEFELQFLQDQQHHDQQKKQAAAAAAAHQANEQYAAFAQAKKFAPGALLFAQQQNKAQPSGGVARQSGPKGGQSQGTGVPAATANMHAQGGPADLGAGLTLGRNPPGNATPSNGVGNGSRGGAGVASRGHMQMARPVSRGGGNSARLPMSVGAPTMPSVQKQGPVAVPVSRQSPPMPAQPGSERGPLDGTSPRGSQGRDGGAAVQGPQLPDHQLAKPELPRQGYKAPTDLNGLRPMPDFALLARPPMSAPSSLPSPSRPPNSAPAAVPDAAPARSSEAHMGNVAVHGKLPVRDTPMQTPTIPTHVPFGGTQVPFLVRDSAQAPSKDANPHIAPAPKIRSPPQERAILPGGNGDDKGLGIDKVVL